MASKHNSLGPASNRLNFPESSAEPLSLTHKEVETLFAPLFDDTMENVLLRPHLIPLHILITIKYLIHLNKQQ